MWYVLVVDTFAWRRMASDARAAMAKLERLVIGNEPPTEAEPHDFVSGKWQQERQTPTLLQSSKRPVFYRLNLVAAVGLEPTTYGL